MKKLFTVLFSLLIFSAQAQTNTNGEVPAATIGFVSDGTTDNSPALATLAANASAPHIYWSPGTYLFKSCPGVTFSAPIIWKGAPGSIIKFACTFPTFPAGIFNSNGKAAYIDGLTFDLSSVANTIGIGTTTFNPFWYFNNASSGIWFQNNQIINAPAQTAHVFLNNVQNAWLTGNWFTSAAPSRNANQCISMTNSGGLNMNVTVSHNFCVNTGMFLTGNGLKINGNEVKGWGYGSGLTLGGAPDTNGAGWLEVVGNYIHDSQPWNDTNNAQPSGIEFWLPHTLIADNVINNVSGDAIGGGGLSATIANNDLSNWGQCTDAACSGLVEYGIYLNYMNASYNGSNASISGNRESNPSSALTAYGYGDGAGGIIGVALNGNTFSAHNGNFPYSQINGTAYTGTDVWNSWTPTLGAMGGSGATLSLNSARYSLQGHTLKFSLQMTLTYTTAPTGISFTVPFPANATSVVAGVETGANHIMLGPIGNSSTTVTLQPSSAFTASGSLIIVSGQYDTQ